MAAERATGFECGSAPLVGIVHAPDGEARVGVLIVVGGPQYRVGSHRQFVLLGRHLAAHGIAAFRFDYRGIGDGAGAARDFLSIDQDIAAAIDAFRRECVELEQIYIWGLCDAASAALFYAHRDERVTGLVLCNPWVRTDSTYAQTIVKDYYRKRVLSVAFWKRLFAGQLNLRDALASFAANLHASFAARAALDGAGSTAENAPFPARMLAGLERFRGRVLLILSGNDLTAAEFENLVRAERSWKKMLRKKSVTIRRLPEANHTFSTRIWRDQVSSWTEQWVRSALPETKSRE